MPNADVQTLVARCLADPVFLEQARHPEDGADTDVRRVAELFGAGRLERLALVRGMMTKVRHNALKQVAPKTFGLLDRLGLELAYFTWVSVPYVQRRTCGPIPTPDFLAFSAEHLERFLTERRTPQRDAVLDMLAHETLLWEMDNTDGGRPMPGSGSGLRWRGHMEMRRFNTHVLALGDALGRGDFDPALAAVGPSRLVGYWRPDGVRRTRVFELQPHAALIFALIDGSRGPSEIMAQLRGRGFEELEDADLQAFLDDAARQGLVAYAAAG